MWWMKSAVLRPKRNARDSLGAGEVGYLVAGIKEIQRGAGWRYDCDRRGRARSDQLPGFEKIKPQVYAGMFPVNSEDFENFREALEKLTLNDASLFYEPETSDALGFGFRCGFLGYVAHGDHSGAPRARVRLGSDYFRAHCGVRASHDATARRRTGRQSVPAA